MRLCGGQRLAQLTKQKEAIPSMFMNEFFSHHVMIRMAPTSVTQSHRKRPINNYFDENQTPVYYSSANSHNDTFH
jgi:hypothetical protein